MTRSALLLKFIESLSIRTRDRRIDRLSLNVPQRQIWSQIAARLDQNEKVWIIVLKARREGISTLSEALLLSWTALDDLVYSVVTAHEAPATKRIAKMADLMIEQSPLKHVTKTVGTTRYIGRSKLDIATAGSPEAMRGADITCFHGSEVAFWPHPEALTATLQAIPYATPSLCILESTANGKVREGALFYEEWTRAVKQESDFLPIFLPWFTMPEYRLPGQTWETLDELDEEERALKKHFQVDAEQMAWRRYCIATMCQGDLDKFHQEYPATAEEAFIQSGLPFFRAKDLFYLEQYIRPGHRFTIEPSGRLTPNPQGPLEIWEMPKPGRQYVIGADSSMGFADDDRSKSTMDILDMETLEQVAEYSAAAAPHVLGRHLVGAGRLYNDAILCPEVQGNGGGGGRETLKYIQECNYWNIHRWTGSGPDRVSPHAGHLYGWETNSRTRPRMLARIREVIMEQTAIIHSRVLVTQLQNFGENDSGRLEAIQGHDDQVFSYGIALVSRSENYMAQVLSAPRAKTDWAGAGLTIQQDFAEDERRHLAAVQAGRPHVLPDQERRLY